VETIRSSLDMRVKPIPLTNTMWEMPPHTNIVAAPASVAITHLYKNFIGLRLVGVACSTLHSPLPSRKGLEQTGGDVRASMFSDHC